MSTEKEVSFIHLGLEWKPGSEGTDSWRRDKALVRILSEEKTRGAGVCAIVDRQGMAGSFAYYKQALAMNIRPVFACRTRVILRDPADETSFAPHELTLLCRNREGWLSLLRLLSLGPNPEPTDLPKLDLEDIRRHHAGLIGISTCISSLCFTEDFLSEIESAAKVFKEVFEPGRFFMDLGDPRDQARETIRRDAVAAASSLDVPVIITTSDVTSPADLEKYCVGFIEVLSNTVRIADLCEVVSPANKPSLPTFIRPEGLSDFEYLKSLAEAGLDERLSQMRAAGFSPDEKLYRERLSAELEPIATTQTALHFLIVHDYIHFARSNGIVLGPGRGSSVSSLVVFALKLSDVDPIRHGLHYECFMNLKRYSMPFFYVNFCAKRLDEIMRYLVNRYGPDVVGRIVPSNDYEQIEWNGTVALSDRPLWELMPVRRSMDTTADPIHLVCRYNMDDAQQVGIFVTHLTGLKILSTLDKALKLVNSRMSPSVPLTFDTLPFDDPESFRLLSTGDTNDIFLLEDLDMQRVLRILQPRCFEDIVAAISLYRPGAINSGLLTRYLRARRGERSESTISGLNNLLRETGGVLIYREQVMDVLHHFTGWPLGECDLDYRRFLKKRPDDVQLLKNRFLDAATEKSISLEEAERCFELLSNVAGATSVKHHFVAYAIISARCAYLKAHYPEEWASALR